jgi:REP element-mobilizing transposase RayT
VARKLRVQYPGAIYHVMNRGDRREDIFRDDEDRQRFLDTLGEACGKTGWQVLALCLMPNHFHLVVETPQANLVAGMKWFLGTYTARFNRRHKVFGHLFSGRYKALVVDGSGSGYLKTVCDYVHLNPARARLLAPTEPLRTYEWSSWPEYLKPPARRWPWLRVERLLGEYRIPKDSAAGRRRLEEARERRRGEEEGGAFAPVRRGWFLGDDQLKCLFMTDARPQPVGQQPPTRSPKPTPAHRPDGCRRLELRLLAARLLRGAGSHSLALTFVVAARAPRRQRWSVRAACRRCSADAIPRSRG